MTAVLLAALALFSDSALHSETVPVRHTEGLLHGFLVLRTVEGDTLADGDWIQTTRGDSVTDHLVFRFTDDSTHDETAVFSHRRGFRLLNAHLVQKGPAFPHPIEMMTRLRVVRLPFITVRTGKKKSQPSTLTCRLTWRTLSWFLRC